MNATSRYRHQVPIRGRSNNGLTSADPTEACLATVWAVYRHGQVGRNLTMRHGAFGLLAREYLAR
jgi:hypothetical protein